VDLFGRYLLWKYSAALGAVIVLGLFVGFMKSLWIGGREKKLNHAY